MKKHNVFVTVFLVICLAIYLFYRTDKTVINEVVIRAISFNNYVSLKELVKQILPLNEFVIYSLPQGLWTFCITVTSSPYYIGMKGRKIDFVFVPLICCIGLEIAQLLHITNGRFDPMDIWVTILFWAIAVIAFDNKMDKQNLLTPINGSRMVCVFTYGIVCLAHVLD